MRRGLMCLNPYYVGRCSVSKIKNFWCVRVQGGVLILIMLEDALWVNFPYGSLSVVYGSLNPYYVGRCSVSVNSSSHWIR